MTKRFEAKHLFFSRADPITFGVDDAPDWLTSVNSVKGSTMDTRWFWVDHVLKLEVGQSIDTDFRTITRIL